MKSVSFFSVVAVAILMLPLSAHAATEREKAELARVVSELKYLKQDVLQISELRRADDTEAFNYEALVKDLDTIVEAVERHVTKPSRQPRVIKPLEAEHGYIH